jgi:hypothetical protein
MVKSGSFAELANLGPKSEKILVAAGITSLEQLRKLGSVAAYSKVKRTGKQCFAQPALGARRYADGYALARGGAAAARSMTEGGCEEW